MNKKKSYASGVNIGSSSILVTFVLLCLVTFAALSFVSANADNRLAKQTAERTTGYYEANNSAENTLKSIDVKLRDYFRNTKSEKDFYAGINDIFISSNQEEADTDENTYITVTEDKNGDHIIQYNIRITDNQSLYVTLKVLYPESANDDMFEIKQWETVTEYVEDVPGSEESGFLF